MFFLSLYQTQGGSSISLDDVQKGPPSLTVDEINHAIDRATANVAPVQDGLLEQIAELQKQVEALAVLPAQITTMLSQLADVSAMNPSDGDKLIYNGTTGTAAYLGVFDSLLRNAPPCRLSLACRHVPGEA
jgi:hypothetical protein